MILALTLLAGIGMLLIPAGIALIYLPAGVIALGVSVLLSVYVVAYLKIKGGRT